MQVLLFLHLSERLRQRRIRVTAGDHAVEQACYEQHDEQDGQEFGNTDEGSCQATETEYGCNDGEQEESDGPVNHDNLLW